LKTEIRKTDNVKVIKVGLLELRKRSGDIKTFYEQGICCFFFEEGKMYFSKKSRENNLAWLSLWYSLTKELSCLKIELRLKLILIFFPVAV